MAAIRRSNTTPEIELRRNLHSRGLRFRKDYALRLDGRLVRPDVAFTRWHLAVFVDGCFWHSRPEHETRPTANTVYWNPKLAGNETGDEVQTSLLEAAGWRVRRFWEHENPEQIAADVAAGLSLLRQSLR